MAWTMTHAEGSNVYTFTSDGTLANLDVVAMTGLTNGLVADCVDVRPVAVGNQVQILDGSASGGEIINVTFDVAKIVSRHLYGRNYKPLLVAANCSVASPSGLKITFIVGNFG